MAGCVHADERPALENEEYIRQVLAAGALGYVLKDAAARDLLGAIRAVWVIQLWVYPS